ncbi:MAG: phosphate ABC transporter permease subunit PstC [Ignisphaera sp.]
MRISRKDMLFFLTLIPFSISLLAILAIAILVLISRSFDALNTFGYSLFTTSVWDPEHGRYGLLAPIIGSITTSILATATALIFSVPLAILLAEYLHDLVRDVLSSIVELMSGVPTIIYAMWASMYLAPILKTYVMDPLSMYISFIPIFSCKPVTAFTLFSAGISIGISITPYVTAMIFESYESIPITYKEACLGIGATRYETIKVLLSLAKPAIIASVILGFARALGETTIAVTTIGNSMYLGSCIFSPGYTVSALIASQFSNAYLYRYAESVLYTSALVVLVIAIILSFIGLSLMSRWRRRVVV